MELILLFLILVVLIIRFFGDTILLLIGIALIYSVVATEPVKEMDLCTLQRTQELVSQFIHNEARNDEEIKNNVAHNGLDFDRNITFSLANIRTQKKPEGNRQECAAEVYVHLVHLPATLDARSGTTERELNDDTKDTPFHISCVAESSDGGKSVEVTVQWE